MALIKECFGRKFAEVPNFETNERIPGRPSHNYLTTIENGYDIDKETKLKSDKVKFRIQRWQGINDKNNSSIKYWEVRPRCLHYNINSIEQLEDISNILNDLTEGHDTISLTTEEYNKLHQNLRKQRSKTHKLLEMIRELKDTKEAEQHIFKQRIFNMRSKIREYEAVLNNYKTLISNSDTTETQVKKYLVENNAFWMFGIEYIGIDKEVGFPPGKNDYYFDLMLQRHDDFWDLVECKGPNENLFDKRTKKRSKPNEKLSEAVSQVFTYLYAIDKTWNEKLVKPKAYIVIGKHETDKPLERRVFSSYLSNVELITYFDLFERGSILLKHVKTK